MKVNPAKVVKRIVAICVCFILMVTIIPRVKTIWDLNQRKQQVIAEKTRAEKENRQLKAQLKEAKSPKMVERIAREKLRMVKDGESYVIEVSPH